LIEALQPIKIIFQSVGVGRVINEALSSRVRRGCLVFKASAASNGFDLVLAVAALTTWVATVSRLVPDRSSDRGIFVSVAERLLAGDTLYSGVYDNKEPLFYYFVAGQLTLGPWAEIAAEALLIAIAAAASYFMAVKLASRQTAVAVSFIAVPITLTGEFYFPGYTELPGIALVLASITASASERSVLSGLCMGLLVFTKLIFLPIALVGACCFLQVRRKFFEIPAIALGALIAVVVVTAVLVVRGELLPFIETIKLNVAYSQGGGLIGSKEGLASLAEHVRRIGGWRLFGEVTPILLAIVLVFIGLSGQQERTRMQIAVACACVATFVSSLAVLSITGLWEAHRQILYIPSIIAILGLTLLLDVAAKRARFLALGVVILMGCLMAGTLTLTKYITSVRSFRSSYAALGQLSLEARRLLAIGSMGTYARLGPNDDLGHAVGLRHWKLACPRFHQYPFESAALLNEAFECASKAPTLIISADLTSLSDAVQASDPRFQFLSFWQDKVHLNPDARPAWNQFVARVERLSEGYSCDASSGLRICKRPPGN
jgi:hypothetical protein